jgi:hypothetical protein
MEGDVPGNVKYYALHMLETTTYMRSKLKANCNLIFLPDICISAIRRNLRTLRHRPLTHRGCRTALHLLSPQQRDLKERQLVFIADDKKSR